MAIRSFIMNGSLYLRWWIGFIKVTLVITHIGNKQVKWGDPPLVQSAMAEIAFQNSRCLVSTLLKFLLSAQQRLKRLSGEK